MFLINRGRTYQAIKIFKIFNNYSQAIQVKNWEVLRRDTIRRNERARYEYRKGSRHEDGRLPVTVIKDSSIRDTRVIRNVFPSFTHNNSIFRDRSKPTIPNHEQEQPRVEFNVPLNDKIH